MSKKFVHLHVHTEYSLLDGLSKIPDMLKYVKEKGMDAIAITDHGAMYGAIEFYKACRAEKIKPIIGLEAYITNFDHRDKSERGKSKNYHLILLAKDKTGYENLMKISSIAHLEGFYYKPRLDKKTLARYSKGIICTSACAQGEIAQLLINNQYKKAKEVAIWYSECFGQDYYLEIQNHDYEKYIEAVESDSLRDDLKKQSEDQRTIIKGVIKLSRELGIPIVATNDAHYIKKEDAIAQDALVCVATGKNVSDIKRLRFVDVPSFYLKSTTEMYQLFPDLPEALENSIKIAERCGFEIDLNKWFFPEYKLKKGKTPDSELKERVWREIKTKVPKLTTDIKKRLAYEINIIKEKGYSTYFLIMSDMVKWANKNGIVTNTRGSAAGSLASYALEIISINPLDYDLPFERFLTPWRPSPPDIDLDIADDRREEVVDYITKKYGNDRVAQICTFGRMLARGSIRDIARVMGYPYAVGDKISKTIPLGSQGFPMSIEKALKVSPDLQELYKTDADAKKIVELAKQVEGNARHISVHAAGLVISPEEITKYVPVQLDPEGKKVITQYDMNALDPNVSPNGAVGLLKFDLLGLRNLSILGSTVRIIKATRGEKIDIQKIPLNDKKTYQMLSRGDTMGVFQLSGSGMTRYLKELKPERIEDIMAMVALYRPGPMAKIPEYIDRKNNPKKISYFDPRMKEYLAKSRGLLVYQDDVFATAINIAGYSWEEADKFRKAVGKKVPKEMEKQRMKFIEGAVKGGMKRFKAQQLFKLIEPFSGYGFNKAHAASYGLIAYKTAFLKANYPVEFMCAYLTAESNDKDKISAAVHECKRLGIEILPPDVNESLVGFTIINNKNSKDGKGIRFGLSAIKNVGKAAIEAIISQREERPFVSLADFVDRVDSRKVNKKVLDSLIKVGAMSKFGSRAGLISVLDEVRSKVGKSTVNKNQQGLFSQAEIKKSMETKSISEISVIEEFSDNELQIYERQLLGFSLSAKPVGDLILPLIDETTHKIFEITSNESLDELVKIAGVVSEVRIVVTKRSGQEMAFVRIEDNTGSIDLVVFPKLFKQTRDIWVNNKPLLIAGKVDSRDESLALIVESVETEKNLKEKSNHLFSQSNELSLRRKPKVLNPRLFINVPKNVNKAKLKELKNLLLKNPGYQKVSLVFEGQEKIRVDLGIRINWNEKLAAEISQILETS